MRICDFCKAEKKSEFRPNFEVKAGGATFIITISAWEQTVEKDCCDDCAMKAINLYVFNSEEKPVDPSDKKDIYGNVK